MIMKQDKLVVLGRPGISYKSRCDEGAALAQLALRSLDDKIATMQLLLSICDVLAPEKLDRARQLSKCYSKVV